MTDQDFLDYCERTLKDARDTFPGIIPNFSHFLPPGSASLSSIRNTNIFFLGKDKEVSTAIESEKDFLLQELTEDYPLPFPDTACITRMDDDSFLMDRIVEAPYICGKKEFQDEAFKLGLKLRNAVMITRVSEKIPIPLFFYTIHCGPRTDGKPGSIGLVGTPSVDALFMEKLGRRTTKEEAADFVNPIMLQLALISHPANYIVKVTPSLTTHEKHLSEKGRERAIRKLPHYIVVDHDVLVELRRSPSGTHASPVPHKRRGHWARLADRCKKAFAEGRYTLVGGVPKIHKRWAQIGDPAFGDENNQYLVLTDFEPYRSSAPSNLPSCVN